MRGEKRKGSFGHVRRRRRIHGEQSGKGSRGRANWRKAILTLPSCYSNPCFHPPSNPLSYIDLLISSRIPFDIHAWRLFSVFHFLRKRKSEASFYFHDYARRVGVRLEGHKSWWMTGLCLFHHGNLTCSMHESFSFHLSLRLCHTNKCGTEMMLRVARWWDSPPCSSFSSCPISVSEKTRIFRSVVAFPFQLHLHLVTSWCFISCPGRKGEGTQHDFID